MARVARIRPSAIRRRGRAGLDKGKPFSQFPDDPRRPRISRKQMKFTTIGTSRRLARLIMRTSVHMSVIWTRSVPQGDGHWALFVWTLRQEPRPKCAFD